MSDRAAGIEVVRPRSGAAARSLLPVVVAATLAGGFAWTAVQAGAKGIIAGVGVVGFACAMVVVPQRRLLVLGAAVLSLGLLMHKSVGPIAANIASGPPAIYVTTFDVLLVVLYVMWLFEGTMLRDLVLAFRRPVVWMPLAGIVLSAFSLLVADNVVLGVAELWRMTWLYLGYLYIAGRVRTRAQVWTIVVALAALAVFELLVILAQWKTNSTLGLSLIGTPTELTERTLDAGGRHRPFGTITHPVFMGAFMSSLGLMALSFAIHLRRRWRRMVAAAMVPVCLLPLVISHARAALLAFMGSAALLVAFAVVMKRLRMRTVVAGLAILMVAATPFLPQLKARYLDNFGTDHYRLEIESRNELNEIAVDMIKDHPLLGVGLNNFQQVQEPYERFGLIFAGNPVHNIYLLQASETGFIGLFGMLALGFALISVSFRLARARAPIPAAIGTGVTAVYVFFAVEEILGFSLRQDVPRTLFWILSGLVVACSRLVEETRPGARRAPDAASARAVFRLPAMEGVRRPVAMAIATAMFVGGTAGAYAHETEPQAQLVFSAVDRNDPNARQAIYVVNEDGSGFRRVSPDDGRRYDWSSWAFNGTKIIYTAREGEAGSPENLFIMNPDGTGEQQLTFGDWRAAQPKMSPDGRKVVFTLLWEEFPYAGVYMLDLETLQVTNLSAQRSTRGALDSDPRWSLDGERLVFATSINEEFETIPTQIALMRPDGKHRRRLTVDEYYNTDPALSADGEWMVTASFRGDGHPGEDISLPPDDDDPAPEELRLPAEAIRSVLEIDDSDPLELPAPTSHFPAAIRHLMRARPGTTVEQGTGGDYSWPVSGTVRSGYGWRTHPILAQRRFHRGVDIAAPSGTPVRAARAGTVLFAGQRQGYGLTAMVRHANGIETLYAHLRTLHVRPGQLLKDGEVLGEVGCTGLCTGPHLHFEAYDAAGAARPITVQQDNAEEPIVRLVDWHLVVKPVDGPIEEEIVLTEGGDCAARPLETPCGPLEGPSYAPLFLPDGSIGYLSVLSRRRICICSVEMDGSNPRVVFASEDLAIQWWDMVIPGEEPTDAIEAVGKRMPQDRLLISGIGDDGSVTLSVYTPDMFSGGTVSINSAGVNVGSEGLKPLRARWSADRSKILFTARVPYDPDDFAPWPPPPEGEKRRMHFTLDDLEHNFVPPVDPDDEDVAEEQVFIMDADGSNVRQLTDPWIEDYMDGLREGEARGNTDPQLSADGRYLLVTNVAADGESFLLRIDLETNEVYNLTNATAGAVPVSDASARLSPDGSKVAFASNVGSTNQIFVFDIESGKQIEQVTDDAHFNVMPSWAPDGETLVFSSYRGDEPFVPEAETAGAAGTAAASSGIPNSDWHLVARDIETGAEQTLLQGGDSPVFSPVWSPDGTRIAFISNGEAGEPDVYVVNADGTGLRPLQVTLRTHEQYLDWR